MTFRLSSPPNLNELHGQWILYSQQLFGVNAKHLGDLPYLPDVKCQNCRPGLSPLFDDQTSPRAITTGNLDNDACLLDPPLVLWDKVTQRNCVVLDCFSSQIFEDTTYYRLQPWQNRYKPFWRFDDQVEEQATFHGYDFGELCWQYSHQFDKSYTGSTASIKGVIEALLSRKADVSHSRSRDGGREIIGDLSDMIVRAMHWREEGGLGYE